MAAGLVAFIAAGYGEAPKGKVPISTSSEEALQLFLQGRDLQERLQVQESLASLQKAVEKDPNFALAYLFLSFAQPTNKEFFEDLDKAVALVDKVSEGEKLWILGQEAGIKGQPMKQRDYFQKLVQAYPDDERARNLMGIHYFGQQEWELAIPECKKATEINPEFSTPYNQLGYAYRFLGKYEEAEKAFKKYIELIPNDPNPYDSHAELMMKMGRFDESIASYRKALEQNPNFVASYIGIATDLDLKGEHEKARGELQKLYNIARTDAERRAALFATAVSYVDEGRMEDALRKAQEQYDIAAKTSDAAAMAEDLSNMGDIRLEAGKSEEAMAKYQQAARVLETSSLSVEVKDNGKRQFLYDAACVASKKGDFKTAKVKAGEFRSAVQAANNPLQIKQSHQLEGIIALAEKDFDKAIAELQQASFEYNPYNYYRLALAYQGKGNRDKARENFTKASNFNGLDGFTYAFIRAKANKMLATL